MQTIKRKIRFGHFILAAVFFCNPYMGTIDILPDFIGYLIICAAISPLCEINEHFSAARNGFLKALYVAIARLALSSFMTFNNFLSNDTFILFFLFVFAVLNAIFAIPALSALKNGIQYLPMYAPSTVIDKPIGKRMEITKNELAYAVTVIYLIVHSLLSVLPEFFTLNVSDELGNINYNAAAGHGFFRAVCFFALIPIGIAWLVLVCSYLAKLCKDKKFVSALDGVYYEKACMHENVILQRELKKGTMLISAALICSLDIFFDGVSLLPNFISACLMFFAVCSLKNHVTQIKNRKILCCVAGVASAVKTVLEISFSDKYSYLRVPTDLATRKAYIVLSVANVVDVILHLILIFTAISMLREIINAHTGFSLSGADDSNIRQLHKSFYLRLVPIEIFAILRTLTSVFYYISKPHSGWYFELSFSYHIVACAIFALLSVLLIKRIYEEIAYKYMSARE